MTATALVFLTCTALGPAEVHTDYYEAYRKARDTKSFLLIDFGSGFDFSQVPPQQLAGHVLCRIPAGYTIEVGGARTRLLDRSAFWALEGRPGLAVVDLRNREHFGRTVSVLPQRHVTPFKVAAVLGLPAGTLTQRTLVWAFRIHPERPQSVYGTACPYLMAHCQRHCGVQCASNDQHHAAGHPGSTEIVAESWPWNRNVVDAAIDIVQSWRGSPGHWGAASRPWARYGYDMQTNGQKWYATGVFM